MDKDGASDTAYNASIDQTNKHIDIAYHYVRDCILAEKSSWHIAIHQNKHPTLSQNPSRAYSMNVFEENKS